ncbi:dihydrofolate reductase [Lactococcus fujiensis]|uniref:Dihydrofolate reductase n=1 Tax=Lactococcus fujiensis JCM 16395 TaxID=1291764 RepID=A0A2A5RJX0_9LACT|nr:dihydrofolate reductase [Lactococcus fujiensis]PCR99456.1 dihydrofolate reductase [Lactococcus fujiensis JCM 16395]
MIYGIWAEDEHGLIGRDGKLPWRLPKELQHFKQVTMNQVLLMGRKTFDGMNKRILPGRQSIVLTHDLNYEKENKNLLVFHSKEEVLEWYKQQDKTLFITGGAEMFRLFEKDMDGFYRTLVHGTFVGDAYFPEAFDFQTFHAVAEEDFGVDEKNAYAFTIKRYVRK